MCGIAGWIDYNIPVGEEKKTADRMSATLQRRGPDAHGEYFGEEVFLVHRRLAVVDPQNGLQPMTKGERGSRYVITYNGELYNTEELRGKLQKLGYTFTSYSDTEVLLTSYIAWGEECLAQLNGIFAFGIWDEQKKRFFAARDRCGVKPFFYHLYKGGLVFGSEIKTLLAHPKVNPKVDKEGLFQIFLLGPGRRLGSGIFQNICELRPGNVMTFDKNGLSTRVYWKLQARAHIEGEKETIAHTRFLVEDAIERQLVSDVPLCTLLSGGLDSSIISLVAAKKYKKEGRQLTTYSVDYVDNDQYFQKSLFQPSSDAPFITKMADAIQSRHKEVILSNKKVMEALNEAVYARDLPGMTDIDSSLLLFSQEIKKDYTVGLSGECADEIFGGYPWYHNPDILFENTFPWSRSTALRRSIFKEGVLPQGGEEYVRTCYEDTLTRAEALPGEDMQGMRIRQMFLLNFEWFMQTLLELNDIKVNI